MPGFRLAATIVCVALFPGSQARADVTREVIFVTGQPAVGFPAGATIQSVTTAWTRPQMNSRGHVLLNGVVLGGGVSSQNDQGLWLATRDGLVLLLREGDSAHGIPNATIRVWYVYGLTDVDEVILHVQFAGEGVSSTNDTAVGRIAPGGELAYIAREGDAVSDDPADGTWLNFVFQTDVAGATRLVLRATDILATPLGARTFTSASNVTLTPNGLMAVHAMLSNPASTGIILAQVGCPDSACDGVDLDGDCRIGLQDLATLLGGFGRAGLDLPGDFDDSGDVDLQNLAMLLTTFGQDCSGG